MVGTQKGSLPLGRGRRPQPTRLAAAPRRRRVVVAAGAAAVLAVLTACGSSSGGGGGNAAGSSIDLGISVPLSGAVGSSCGPMNKAMLAWFKHVNATGGVNGKKIKGATKSRLKVTKRMKRKYLKVSITGHRRYYEPETTYSTSYKVYGPNLS